MFRSGLKNTIDTCHSLVKLGDAIDWEVFDRELKTIVGHVTLSCPQKCNNC